ncbi:MAG: hypothetical protein JW954_07365 [Dehalococcoidaceae bacterium]|nr:hypothetical protein [Dehalococcoidaceae bacterium]
MKTSTVKAIIFLSVLVGSLILASCVQGELTTVTVTTGSDSPTATQTITITKTVGTTGTTTATGTPSATPHSLDIELGRCFFCHTFPPGHEGRMLTENICWSCHYEAPIDEWKVGSWH